MQIEVFVKNLPSHGGRQKRNAIVSAFTSRARKLVHKHSVKAPSTVEQACAIDKKNSVFVGDMRSKKR